MYKKIIIKLIPVPLLIMLLFSSCDRIDLRAYAAGIPLKEVHSWTAFESVLTAGTEGNWDTVSLGDASVILDNETYRIWYVGRNGSGHRIIYAESADGKTWSNHQQALDHGNLPGADDGTVTFPVVIKFGQIYKMWYSGGDSLASMSIIYCESYNGYDWNNFEHVLTVEDLDSDTGNQLWSPQVLMDGNTYRMWVSLTDSNTVDRIIYCESNDGKEWSNFQTAVDIGNVTGFDDIAANSPTVLKDGGIYKMWYSGQAMDGEYFKISTIYCDSIDGINWENFQVVMEAGAEGTVDSKFVTGPVVINNNGKGMMWYRGSNEASSSSIIYCETK